MMKRDGSLFGIIGVVWRTGAGDESLGSCYG